MPPTSPPVLATASYGAIAPLAERLAAQLAAHHPGAPVVALSLDGSPVAGAEVIPPTELRIPDGELLRRTGRTSDFGAATALLPELGRLLLDAHSRVILVDPLVEVLGPLDDVAIVDAEALRLVPRVLAALPVDDRHPTVAEAHARGVHLPTLLGVGPGAGDVLSWWSAEIARDPSARGALLDLAATRVAHTTCRSPGQGLNPARLGPDSRLDRVGDELVLDGEPVCSIDTSGRSPDEAHLLTADPGLRARLGDHPALAAVLAERDEAVPRDPGHRPVLRRLYAEALRRHELLGDAEPPPPADRAALVEWLAAPDSRVDGLSRLAMGLWRLRPDLQSAFPEPDLGPVARAELVDWIRRDGVHQMGLEPDLVPAPVVHDPAPLVPGVDLAGYVDADLGVGEIARLVRLALDHAGIATAVQTIGGSANRRATTPIPADDGPEHPTEIICVNADRIGPVVAARGRDPEAVHTIGVFFWETDVATPEMHDGIGAVDEIWAGSEWVAERFRSWTDRPVNVLPVPVVPPSPVGHGPELLGVDGDRPVVLLAYDFHSVARRKNPEGLVAAFREAVAPDEGPVLVLKSINGDRVPDELDRLRWAVRDRDDMRIVDGYVAPGELSAMIRDAAVYASLHRSEGFGLTIAHAMALGTPVLCTEGSGPADFVDDRTAVVIPGATVEVGPGADPYPPEGTWWEPDPDAAVAGLRHLLDDRTAAATLADAAAHSIGNRTVEAAARFARARIDARPTRRRRRRR